MKIKTSFIPRKIGDDVFCGVFVWVDDPTEEYDGYVFSLYLDGLEVPELEVSFLGDFYFFGHDIFEESIDVKFVAKGFFGDLEENTVSLSSVSTCRLVIPNAKGMVKVEGRLVDSFGRPLAGTRISCKLKIRDNGPEFSGRVICRDIDSFVTTDESGSWYMFLHPNIDSSGGKIILPEESFYIFVVMDEKFERVVDANDGDTQAFFALQSPSGYRYRSLKTFGLNPL